MIREMARRGRDGHVLTHLRRVLAMLFVVVLAGCGSQVEMYTDMPEHEANEILAALLNAGIPAQRVSGKDGVAVRVSSADMAHAVDVLRARGLPRERFQGMGEIFRKEGLISSPVEERARFLFALSQELSNTIAQIDGVLTARVHLVLPERGTGGDPGVPSSAAVFIKHNAEVSLDAVQPQIRRLVSNSIPSLSGDNVSLVLVAAHYETEMRETQLAEVLGFRVAADSAGRLAQVLIVLALLAAVGIVTSLALAWMQFGPRMRKRDGARAEASGQAEA